MDWAIDFSKRPLHRNGSLISGQRFEISGAGVTFTSFTLNQYESSPLALSMRRHSLERRRRMSAAITVSACHGESKTEDIAIALERSKSEEQRGSHSPQQGNVTSKSPCKKNMQRKERPGRGPVAGTARNIEFYDAFVTFSGLEKALRQMKVEYLFRGPWCMTLHGARCCERCCKACWDVPCKQ